MEDEWDGSNECEWHSSVDYLVENVESHRGWVNPVFLKLQSTLEGLFSVWVGLLAFGYYFVWSHLKINGSIWTKFCVAQLHPGR